MGEEGRRKEEESWRGGREVEGGKVLYYIVFLSDDSPESCSP